MLDKLNQVISEFVQPLIVKYKWELENEKSSGMGALKEYTADNFYIRIVNDRGLLDIEICSKYDKENLRCLSFYKDWHSPPKRGQSNLSIKQQCTFLSENWLWLNEQLNKQQAAKTLKSVDDYLQERV